MLTSVFMSLCCTTMSRVVHDFRVPYRDEAWGVIGKCLPRPPVQTSCHGECPHPSTTASSGPDACPFLSHVQNAKFSQFCPHDYMPLPPPSLGSCHLPAPSSFLFLFLFWSLGKSLSCLENGIFCALQFLARLSVHTSNPFACSEIRLLEMKVKKTHRSFLLLILIHPSPHTMKQVPMNQVIWLKMVGKADIQRGKGSKVNM